MLAVKIHLKGCGGEEGLAIFSLPRAQNRNQQVEATGRHITASQQENLCEQRSTSEVECASCLSHLLVYAFHHLVNTILHRVVKMCLTVYGPIQSLLFLLVEGWAVQSPHPCTSKPQPDCRESFPDSVHLPGIFKTLFFVNR